MERLLGTLKVFDSEVSDALETSTISKLAYACVSLAPDLPCATRVGDRSRIPKTVDNAVPNRQPDARGPVQGGVAATFHRSSEQSALRPPTLCDVCRRLAGPCRMV